VTPLAGYSWCTATLYEHDQGAVAQLVARLVRIEKVRGSIPLSSTLGFEVETRHRVVALLQESGTGV
jgi:hypothetical protein